MLFAGVLSIPGTALASSHREACAAANDGHLDLSGTQPATVVLNEAVIPGSVFLATLSGGVTNSLLEVDGVTIFSGETSGTGTFTATTSTIVIVYDLQGTGAQLRLTCTLPDDPDDPDPDDPDPAPASATETTRAVANLNNPLGPLLGGLFAGDPPRNPLGPLLNGLFSGPACPTPTVRSAQIDSVNQQLEAVLKAIESAKDDVAAARAQKRAAEATVFTISLTQDRRGTAAAVLRLNAAEDRLTRAESRLEGLEAEAVLLEGELEDAIKCAPQAATTFTPNQYAALPSAYAPNSPVSAFASFGPGNASLGGTSLLVDENGVRVWAKAAGSLFGGGGTADIAGAKGSVSIGAGRRLSETTAIAGQISVLGGRTEIGASNTTADFAAINALIASSHKLAESVRLDLGLAGGYAWNSINIAGVTGQFGSGEVAAFASLGGEHEANGFVLAPAATIVASHLATTAYTLSDNTTVGATGTSRLDLSGGLRISRPMVLVERDLLLTPFVEVSAGYGLSSPASVPIVPGTSLALGGPIAAFAAGIEGERFNGISFNLHGGVTARSSGLWSIGVSGGIGGSF